MAKRKFLSIFNVVLILSLVACGSGNTGGGTPPPSPKSVTISPKTLTLSKGTTRQFSASVSGTTNQAVRWRVNGIDGGGSVHGWISKGGVYVAPTTVPSPPNVSVTAVSFVDPTKSDSASVTIQAGSNVSVAIAENFLPVIVPTFGSHAFSAAVTGTSNTTVTWQVNGVVGGSPATGTISSTGIYSAPHSAPVSTATNNDGQTTDVIVTAVSQADPAASDSVIVLPLPAQQNAFPEPVPLGTSGGNGKDTSTSGAYTFCCSGTLGSLVSRGGKLFILSNNHVLARSDLASPGDPVIQPGLVDNNCTIAGASLVATLSQFINLETQAAPHVDAALAEVQPGAADLDGTILQLGGTTNGDQPTDGTPNPGPGVPPTIGRNVAKSGSATGLTCASILAIHVSISVDYQKECNADTKYTVTYQNQIDIPGLGFSAEGDSGSLIVTQDTADPVGLLYGGSDVDTVANPVADVLAQLADQVSGEKPIFAGDALVGPHPVSACTLPQPQPGMAQNSMMEISSLSADILGTAISARDAHLPELLAHPGVQAVGTGASYDNPREPAILVFVSRGQARPDIPAQVDGVRTRIVEGNFTANAVPLSAAVSAALEQAAGPPQIVYPISDAEAARAKAVHAMHAADWMKRPGIQGVGISSSVDSPGEAALIIFVIRGVRHDPIPPVIDGLRTRIRESSRFRAR